MTNRSDSSGASVRLTNLQAIRWLIPAALAPVIYVFVAATPLGPSLLWIFAAPAFAVHWIFYVFATARRLDRAVRGAAWRQVGALSVVMAVLLFCLWSPLRIMSELNFASDALHLAVMEPSYNQQIASLPSSDQSLVVFYLGGSPFNSIVLVYDQSDQVILPPALRSVEWVRMAKETDLSCDPDAWPLWGHWYTVLTQC